MNAKTTERILKIDGMHCDHCKMRVENALRTLGIDAVSIDLKKRTATIGGAALPDDTALRTAVTDAGFSVTEISDKPAKRSLFHH